MAYGELQSYVSTIRRTIPALYAGGMDWKEYGKEANWHHYAKLFPRMDSEELSSLAEDIRKNGLQEPVRLFEGKVLDGRNRVLACIHADVKPQFVQWHRNGVSPLAFVIGAKPATQTPQFKPTRCACSVAVATTSKRGEGTAKGCGQARR